MSSPFRNALFAGAGRLVHLISLPKHLPPRQELLAELKSQIENFGTLFEGEKDFITSHDIIVARFPQPRFRRELVQFDFNYTFSRSLD